MKVEIITEGSNSWPEPMMNPLWSGLKKVQWQAGLAYARTGVTFRISRERRIIGFDKYTIHVSGRAGLSFGMIRRGHEQACDAIHNFASGVEFERRNYGPLRFDDGEYRS